MHARNITSLKPAYILFSKEKFRLQVHIISPTIFARNVNNIKPFLA